MSLDLIPAVYEILEKVKALTGREVRFVEKRAMPTFAGIRWPDRAWRPISCSTSRSTRG